MPLVPLGLWIAIIGYGVLYAGVLKLGGAPCSLSDAFRGRCQPAGSAPPGARGQTQANSRQSQQQQQQTIIGSSPIPVSSSGSYPTP